MIKPFVLKNHKRRIINKKAGVFIYDANRHELQLARIDIGLGDQLVERHVDAVQLQRANTRCVLLCDRNY